MCFFPELHGSLTESWPNFRSQGASIFVSGGQDPPFIACMSVAAATCCGYSSSPDDQSQDYGPSKLEPRRNWDRNGIRLFTVRIYKTNHRETIILHPSPSKKQQFSNTQMGACKARYLLDNFTRRGNREGHPKNWKWQPLCIRVHLSFLTVHVVHMHKY